MCAQQTATSNFAAGLSSQSAAVFSDLLVHHMECCSRIIFPRIRQGLTNFAPRRLGGVGQRLFFLHDGRATPANGGLLTAIQDHASSESGANVVIGLLHQLSEQQKQDLLNYRRSL